jgi:phosphoribosylformylglycinamidine (FGAM) synthase-like enzyme
VTKSVSMDVKCADDVVYVLGETGHELGGSEYFAIKGQLGQNAPRVDPKRARALYERLSHAIDQGLVASCHDCSDGGLGVTLAESAFAGGLGMRIDLAPLGVQSNVAALFSESQSRFVVTVRPNQAAAFEAALAGSACYRVGVVTADPIFDVTGRGGAKVLAPIADLKAAWQQPLAW